jgi:8-oxo-dGTP pyrophosphatase MutT (NUDIX family)
VDADPEPPAGAGTAGGGPGAPPDLHGLVASRVPGDGREAAARERFLSALDRLDRPCDEDANPLHVTASAVVVGRRGTVLHRHRRLGRWMQPGGHLDPGETPDEAALRESQEETGLALAHPPGGPLFIHLDVHQAAGGHTHLDLRYLLLGPDLDPDPPPGESPDARWYAWPEAEAAADEALAGALREARAAWERNRDAWEGR